jgi:P-type Mg2+ transporter
MKVLTPPRPNSAAALGLPAAAGTSIDEVFARLASSEAGLSGPDAAARLKTYGPNVLPARPVTATGIMLGQLRNPLLGLLLAAAAVSALTGGLTSAAIIAAILVLSVGLGFVNEYDPRERLPPSMATSTTRPWPGATARDARWTWASSSLATSWR